MNEKMPEWKQKFSRERDPEDYMRFPDAQNIVTLLDEHPSVIVRGEMGAGKSGSIAALRTLLLREGNPVAFFNGHFFATDKNPVAKLDAALTNPEIPANHTEGEQSPVVIVDSADYMYRIGKVAQNARSTYSERMVASMEQLESFMSEHPEARLVLTAHDTNWDAALADPELKALFDEKFGEAAAVYELPTTVSTASLKEFLLDVGGISEGEVDYLLGVLSPSNPNVESILQTISKPDTTFDYKELLRNPRVIGHLFVKFPTLLVDLREAIEGKQDENEFLRKTLEAIVRIDLQSVFLPAMRADVGHKTMRKAYGNTTPLDESNNEQA